MPNIDCKFLKQTTRIMVNNSGQVWPCCYLEHHEYEITKKHQHIFKEYYKNKDKLNLNNYTLREILNNEWFTKTLPESWKNETTCATSCKNWCTKGNDPSVTRIKK